MLLLVAVILLLLVVVAKAADQRETIEILTQEMPDLQEEGVETAVMNAISNIEEEMTKVPLNASTTAISRKLNKLMEQNLSQGEVYELRKSPLTERVVSFRNIIQQATNATAAAAAIAGVTTTEATYRNLQQI